VNTGANGISIDTAVQDVDNTNDQITITSVVSDKGGTIGTYTKADQPFDFTPPLNYVGPIKLTYTISDGGTPVNDPPVANNDPATGVIPASEGQTILINVLGNDTDVDVASGVQAGTTVQITTPPGMGTATVDAATQQIRYTAPATVAATTTTTLQYKITDPATPPGVSNIATVTITLSPKNDPPVASAFALAATEDVDKVFNVFDLGNVSDPDSPRSQWTVQIVTAPAHGTLVPGADGQMTYKPAGNYNGPDSFSYKVNDNSAIAPTNLTSATQTVNITIAEANDAPVANNDTNVGLIINNSNNSIVNTIDVLKNDNFGPDSAAIDGPLVLVSVGNAANPTGGLSEHGGTLTIVNGKVQYKAPDGFDTDFTDSFTYTIQDRGGTGLTASAVASFNVQKALPVNVKATVFQDRPLNHRTTQGDGRRQRGEAGYEYVAVILSGHDFNGNAVQKVLRTDIHGNLTFVGVLPGHYTVREVPPAMTIDGRDSSPDIQAGSDLVVKGAHDQFFLNIPTAPADNSNTRIDLLFGEAGVAPRFVKIEETLTSSGANGLVLATTSHGQPLWNQNLGGWTNLSHMTAQLSANQDKVRITFYDAHGVKTTETFPRAGAKNFRLMGTDNRGNAIIRLDGTAEDFGLGAKFGVRRTANSFAQGADAVFADM